MFIRKQSLLTLTWVFTVGAIAGATAALLYAPMTGKKMQKKVGNLTEKVIESVDDLASAVRRAAA